MEEKSDGGRRERGTRAYGGGGAGGCVDGGGVGFWFHGCWGSLMRVECRGGERGWGEGGVKGGTGAKRGQSWMEGGE